jgi:hypothetical protein
LGDEFGGNPGLAADLLQLCETHPLIGRQLPLGLVLHLGGPRKDRGDFVVGVAAVAHP